jgi:hypothetical protein
VVQVVVTWVEAQAGSEVYGVVAGIEEESSAIDP